MSTNQNILQELQGQLSVLTEARDEMMERMKILKQERAAEAGDLQTVFNNLQEGKEELVKKTDDLQAEVKVSVTFRYLLLI